MTDPLSLAAATVLAHPSHTLAQAAPTTLQATQPSQVLQTEKQRLNNLLEQLRRSNMQPETDSTPEFAPKPETAPAATPERPRSGSQLYSQRIAALQAGTLYTRLPNNSFQTEWMATTAQPTYDQWRSLLAQEARVVARKTDDRPVGIILGDSLSLWFPSDRLPLSQEQQIWLNQSISGETTRHILNRLPDFAQTRPRVIYVMAGVNDLKNGVSDTEIVSNLTEILTRLQRDHPQAKIVMQSILPTRLFGLSRDRITTLNEQLAAIAQEKGIYYLDLYAKMADADGALRSELTTDGLHLNTKGYETWQASLRQTQLKIAHQ